MNPDLIYEATTYCAYPEVEDWCLANVGKWNEAWVRERHDIAAVLGAGDRKQRYFFKTKQDRTMFMLRWS